MLLLDIISGIVQRGGSIINPHAKEDFAQWQENTQNLPKTLYSPQQEKNKFKHNIAKELHKFLTEEPKLKSTDSWELIAYILKFSLIEVKPRKSSDIPADAEVIRKWIER